MDLTGHPDGDPARVGGAVVDVGTGTWAALGVVSALLQRERDGKGRRVQVTMLGAAISYLMHHLVSIRLTGVEPKRLGTAQHNFAPYQAIQSSDGMVMIGVNSNSMWRRAAAALGVPELADDERFATNVVRRANRVELVGQLEMAIAATPAATVVGRLMAASVPASVIRPIGALVDDPQLEALGLWGYTSSGAALPRTPVSDPTVAVGDVPRIGEHTLSVIEEVGIEGELLDVLLAVLPVGETSSRADEKELA
jgi:crotonobetainyl-CoA:carnitine CoA-transferase CaiB-like acyl-CoA transferase